jgi:hypothetical protein
MKTSALISGISCEQVLGSLRVEKLMLLFKTFNSKEENKTVNRN